MFHVHLKSVSILLLLFHTCQLGQVDRQFCSRVLQPYWVWRLQSVQPRVKLGLSFVIAVISFSVPQASNSVGSCNFMGPQRILQAPITPWGTEGFSQCFYYVLSFPLSLLACATEGSLSASSDPFLSSRLLLLSLKVRCRYRHSVFLVLS